MESEQRTPTKMRRKKKRTTRGPTGRPRGSTVAKRVREGGKTGFPFGVIGSQSVKYNSDDLDALKNNESLDMTNLLTFIGKDIPRCKQFCSDNCSFKHRATPVFFTDDPGDLVLDEGEKQSECLSTDSGNLQGTENECCGLQQMPTSVITRAPLWFERSPEVVSYIPKGLEEEYSKMVRDEVGFELPPVMGKCVEQLVGDIWTKVKNESEVDVVNPTLDADYHSLVVDAQVKLAVLLQDYINKRSEPGAMEQNVLADEKAIAREVLGKHHSDVDDVTSSESEEEFKSDTESSASDSPVDAGSDSPVDAGSDSMVDAHRSTTSDRTMSDTTSDSSDHESYTPTAQSTKQRELRVDYSKCGEQSCLEDKRDK